jgi:hypothetical protein
VFLDESSEQFDRGYSQQVIKCPVFVDQDFPGPMGTQLLGGP